MFPGLILMMTGGIAFAIMASPPARVTPRWLRLGGIIGAALIGVVAVVQGAVQEARWPVWTGLGLTGAAVVTQLTTAQLGRSGWQRWAAAVWFLLATDTALAMVGSGPQAAPLLAVDSETAAPALWQVAARGLPGCAAAASTALSSILLGACLMTMLLGHAYLTAGNEMTQHPFRRLVRVLALALTLRAVLSAGAAGLPWVQALEDHGPPAWTTMSVMARYAVGILVPGVFLYMVHDCVNRAANQSATGILYVTLVLIIIGEGNALSLMTDTGLPF